MDIIPTNRLQKALQFALFKKKLKAIQKFEQPDIFFVLILDFMAFHDYFADFEPNQVGNHPITSISLSWKHAPQTCKMFA